jgi:hypothetical protein
MPQFHVSETKQGKTHSTGYIDFELQGTLDRLDGVTEGRCWLLLPERNCLIGDLSFVDPEAKTATFFTSEESVLSLTGSSLPYLDGRWQAYHVWMVVEPEWIWEKVLFQAVDATAERYKAAEVSIVDGQEVYEWIKIERADRKGNTERHCPVYPEGESICLILERMASSELAGRMNIARSAKNTSTSANTGIWIAGITGCVKAATRSTFQCTICPSWIVFSPFPCATIGSFQEFRGKTGTYGWVFSSVFLADLSEPWRRL